MNSFDVNDNMRFNTQGEQVENTPASFGKEERVSGEEHSVEVKTQVEHIFSHADTVADAVVAKNKFPWIKVAALMTVCTLLAAGVSSYLTASYVLSRQPQVVQRSVTQELQQNQSSGVQVDVGLPLLTPAQIGAKASAAVVAINTTGRVQGIFGNVGTVEGAGSGVLISANGYIVTNNHVISNSTTITVNLADGTTHQAEIIGQDPMTDLAVIKIQGETFPYIEMGDSSTVQLGDQVVAIGNPLGELEGSLTVGYISSTNRTVSVKEDSGMVTTLYGLLQTDAAINRGNSGGALISMRGELIGINSVKNTAVGVEGLGFAIPTNTAKPIIEDLLKHGYVTDRPTMGLSGLPIKPEMVTEYGYPQGIYVRGVLAGGPADQAGLQRGDIITEMDGQAVKTISDINGIKNQYKAGDEVELTVVRASETLQIKLVLGAETNHFKTSKAK